MDHAQLDLPKWQTENGHYLAASLKWLRLRLSLLAEETQHHQEIQPVPPPERGSRLGWRQRPAPPPPPPGDRVRILTAGTKAAAEERAKATLMEPPPALQLLADQLRLTSFERDTLLLCAACELDTRVATLCGRAMGNPEHAFPSFALALSLFEHPAWDALSPQRPLRYWRMLEVNPSPSQPLTAAPLRADERIINYIKGLNAMDPRLSLLIQAEDGLVDPLPPSQQASAEALIERWDRMLPGDPPAAGILLGIDTAAKVLVARTVAARMDRQLYRLGSDQLPGAPAEIELLARLWQRESALLPLALLIDAQTEAGPPEAGATLERFTGRALRSGSVILISTREPLARSGFASQSVDVDRPERAEQRDEWMEQLHALKPSSRLEAANRLAGQFSLNLPDIRQIVHNTAPEPLETWPIRLWDASRDRSRPRLDTLAQRIDARATWDDLVVGEETHALLREIVAQVSQRSRVYGDWGFGDRMNRGLGIRALFAGESGTGKTMAAEVIANDLRLTLYRIDLSQVVSKYIGETEKNLQRVFDLMESGGSILFFDEADALFGKRSEVKDSHDRYANIEVNYLLQRMESYTGLAILATNMKSALDNAFLRRLRFVVPFSFPSAPERREMWRRAFPSAVPVTSLDLDRLAKLNLTGASIASVALSASFLAAKDDAPVTMSLVMRAARTEFRKLERPVSEADLKV